MVVFLYYYGKVVDFDLMGWIGWCGYFYFYFYCDYEWVFIDFNCLDIIMFGVVDYLQLISVEFMWGICYLQLDQYEEVIDYFDWYIVYEDSVVGFDYILVEIFFFCGIVLWRKGDLVEVQCFFEMGIELESYNVDFYYWLVKFYFEIGD